MWKLNRIVAENICAFKELDYTLTQGVTTLIFGDNRDNESQRSNGSGKSALLESIAIGMTGSPLRKIRNEEIINDSADGCYVRLELVNSSCDETFTIERNIYRKGASLVRCTIKRDGTEVETDEAVHHSVDGYNKYILEKIGITREELFNNFLLSKHKYEEFLSASDKQKKEIINRFSNGIVVDDAMAKIGCDVEPIGEELRCAELEFASIDGRIEMLSEQIETETNSKEERAKSKTERIATIEQSIATKRSEICEKQQRIASLAVSRAGIKACDEGVQGLEDSDYSIEVVVDRLRLELSTYGTMTPWDEVIAKGREEIDQANSSLSRFDGRAVQAKLVIENERRELSQLQEQYDSFSERAKAQDVLYNNELKQIAGQLELKEASIEKLEVHQKQLRQQSNTLRNKLVGMITCPQCSHEFLLSDDHDFDIAAGKVELARVDGDISKIVAEISDVELAIATIESSEKGITNQQRSALQDDTRWLERLALAKKNIQVSQNALAEIEGKQRELKAKLTTLCEGVNTIRRKIFDEAFELLDRCYTANKRDSKRCSEDISAINGSIETLQNTIAEISRSSPDEVLLTLQASLKGYRERSISAVQKVDDIKLRLSRLTGQQQRFVEFKSFIANTKVAALSTITNEFLESIGSDIRIKFSGYTKLKTGKVREKISVSLVRDGVDLGSFGKFSEGERARVNLASILAMQKLVNSNCDDDKGLDLLVLDEILAAVDEQGHAKMFESLNKLQITALVVSHGQVCESYSHTLTIRKESNESRII